MNGVPHSTKLPPTPPSRHPVTPLPLPAFMDTESSTPSRVSPYVSLSSQVQKLTIDSKTRSGGTANQSNSGSAPTSRGTRPDGTEGKSDGPGSGIVNPNDLQPVIPAMSPAQVAYLSAHRERSGNVTDYKHCYVVVNPAFPTFSGSGVERFQPLAPISQGGLLNNRLTNKIRCHNVKIRMWFVLNPTSIGTQSPIWPTITVFVFREKLPAIPGTPITMMANDTIPPVNTNAIMIRPSLTQSVASDAVATISPINYDKYHMYMVKHIHSQRDVLGEQTAHPATAIQPNWNVPWTARSYEFDIPLHGVCVQYNDSGINQVINALYMSTRIDYAGAANDTANGFNFNYVMTGDLQFTDVQDDAF